MTTVLAVALALVALAAGITIAVLAWKMSIIESDKRAAEAARDVAFEANALAAENNTRLERVIAMLKKDLSDLEADFETCADPGAVRARLRRLLSPQSGEGASGNLPG